MASSMARMTSAVLIIGPTAEGTFCGSTYNEYQSVRPRLLPRSREKPSQTEKAIGRNSPGVNGAADAGLSGRLKMTDHSPLSYDATPVTSVWSFGVTSALPLP